MEPTMKRVLRQTGVYDKIPGSIFQIPSAKQIAELAPNTTVMVSEEVAQGGKTWSKIKTIGSRVTTEGFVASDALGDPDIPVLEEVDPDQMALSAISTARDTVVSGHYLLALGHSMSGLKNDIAKGPDGKVTGIGPLRFSSSHWGTCVGTNVGADIGPNSITDPTAQFLVGAILTRRAMERLKESLKDWPTFAQLYFAWLPQIGPDVAANVLAKPNAPTTKIDAALREFIKPGGPDVQAILQSAPDIFLDGGQPRTVAQVIEALGKRLNASAEVAGKLVDEYFQAHPEEDPSAIAPSTTKISNDAHKLIVEHEVSSRDIYERKYRKPIWPGLYSGITVGIGYDVGHQSADTVRADFSDIIDAGMLAELLKGVGKTGSTAEALLPSLKDKIDVPWEAAMKVFDRRTVPVWTARVEKALPNTELLSGDSLGALVSLAYNRGAGGFNSSKTRFRHMAKIRELMGAKNFAEVPQQFVEMKVLWEGQGLPGLLRRRQQEADLFRKGLAAAPAGAGV